MPAASRPRFANAQDERPHSRMRAIMAGPISPARGASAAHQHFGTLLVSCERADLRAVPDGVMIYQNGTARLDAIPPPAVPRAEVIDEFYQRRRARQSAAA